MYLRGVTENLQEKLGEVLKLRFGFETFREGQLDVLLSVMNRKDALAVMPTGRGKSLCYQIPGVWNDGIVVVVSPLIALMKDQVANLQKKGIAAGCLYGTQPDQEKREVFADMERQKSYLLFISPERVQKAGFATWVKKKNIKLFAIDEAHCVSQWGPDFRKDYHRLNLLREARPDVPILALTATATPPVLKDIMACLQLKTPDKHIHGFYRPNLYYQVEWCDGERAKFALLRQAIKQNPEGRIIVYCGTRLQTEMLAGEFGKEFSNVGYYHAGLPAGRRTEVQNEYDSGGIRILMATNAFGMGIDHPDVRLVTHFQIPANIESFYQEAGRAGRDDKESTCLLLYTRKDRALQAFFIRESKAEPISIKQRWRALDTITQFAEGGECRHGGILTYFRDSFRLRECGHCDTCAPNSTRRIQKPEVVEDPVEISLKKPAKKSTKKMLDDAPLTADAKLRMDVLREWRKDYADSKDVPAFLVFSNKTLLDLAVKAPSTLTQLEAVYGFGPHKVEHLGKEILSVIASTG